TALRVGGRRMRQPERVAGLVADRVDQLADAAVGRVGEQPDVGRFEGQGDIPVRLDEVHAASDAEQPAAAVLTDNHPEGAAAVVKRRVDAAIIPDDVYVEVGVILPNAGDDLQDLLRAVSRAGCTPACKRREAEEGIAAADPVSGGVVNGREKVAMI